MSFVQKLDELGNPVISRETKYIKSWQAGGYVLLEKNPAISNDFIRIESVTDALDEYTLYMLPQYAVKKVFRLDYEIKNRKVNQDLIEDLYVAMVMAMAPGELIAYMSPERFAEYESYGAEKERIVLVNTDEQKVANAIEQAVKDNE